jgi:tripartite-type tricarboxylate transporter receptor subunit TctC
MHMAFQRNIKAKSVLFALAALLLPAFSAGDAWAFYPDRIVRIVVPFAPGGGTDVIARTLAQEMAKDLGATVIIENKTGAGTIIGTEAFKRLAVNEGLVMIAGPPQELDRYFRGEEERWRKVIEDAGIKIE